MEPIVVHHLENSRSQRILWLLEELGLRYEVRPYKRDPETSLAPDELTAIHPLGKSPVITDGDTTVAESGAIIEYLVGKYDAEQSLVPTPGSAEHRQYVYWLHYAEGTLAPLMVLSLILSRIEDAPVPFFLKPVTRGIAGKVRGGYLTQTLDRNLAFLETTLASAQWFAGDAFSAADVQMSFPLEAAAMRLDADSHYPAISAFLDRIHARPAYQRALEKGGKYELLK